MVENPCPGRNGFTLLELLFVTVLAVTTMAIAFQSYARYIETTSSRRAAKLFALDLSVARSTAIRERQPVVIRFDESNLAYEVETGSGRDVTSREYGEDQDLRLSELDLAFPGDSVVFNGRGVADLSGIATTLGEATFRAGTSAWVVSFNSLGASRVREY